jgi:type II secretory pathway component PulK
VQLNPTAPEERERLLNIWSQRWREGFVDHDTALREAGVSNALEVQSKLLAENFLKSENIQGILQGIAAQRIPLLEGLIESTGVGASEADQLAASVLDTQGANQLQNAGNFSPGNQAGTRPQTPGTGMPTTTRPVVPGSLGEADLTARQISSPARSGNQRVPTSSLPAGR